MKKLTAILLAILMIITLFGCGTTEAPATENKENTQSTPKEPISSSANSDETSENTAQEGPEETQEEAPAERTLTVSYEQPFNYDWDKDGIEEVFTFGENAISECGVLTVHFPADSSRDKIIEIEWLIYDCMIAFIDLDGDGTEEVLLTGNDGTYNFVTYAYCMENGTLAPMALASDPAIPRTKPLSYVPGRLLDTLDENGHLQISGNIDLLGTFFVTRPFDMTEDGFGAVRDVVIPFSMENAYPCTLIADLPCTFTSEPNEDIELTDADVMSTYSVVSMTGVRYEEDGSAAAFFATGDGMCGAFHVVPVEGTYGYSWTIGGIYIFDAFEYLNFMG